MSIGSLGQYGTALDARTCAVQISNICLLPCDISAYTDIHSNHNHRIQQRAKAHTVTKVIDATVDQMRVIGTASYSDMLALI